MASLRQTSTGKMKPIRGVDWVVSPGCSRSLRPVCCAHALRTAQGPGQPHAGSRHQNHARGLRGRGQVHTKHQVISSLPVFDSLWPSTSGQSGAIVDPGIRHKVCFVTRFDPSPRHVCYLRHQPVARECIHHRKTTPAIYACPYAW